MAYEIKYLFKFESSNGTTREIRVLQDGYTGEVIQRPLGRAPVLKKQQNGPVHGTSLEFYAECNVDREFIEFYTSDPKAYRVDLYAGATLLWQGYITPELYSEPDIAPPYDVQVVATDGVGELKLYDYAAQGTVTLRALLSGLLARTGLGTDIYLISSLKAGSRGAGALLDMTINLDYMAGKTCYETLTYILDTLHATITWWKGAWILTRETNVTFTSGKVRYFNTAGNSALLADSVQTLGSLRANPAWPVGQLSTVIDPAKNRVTVQAPWHVVTCLQNPDMDSDADWTKAKNARYETDGYVLPININTGTSETAVISQATSMAGIRVPMNLSVKATGATSEISAQVIGAVLGVLLTYKVSNVTYHLVKGDGGAPVWQQGDDIGTYIPLRTRVDFQQPLATWDSSRIEAEELAIENIPPFLQGTTFPAGTLTVYILGYCAKIYGAYLDVVLPKGYQDVLRIDNGARGEGSEVEIAIGRETADNAYYAAFLQGLLLDSGNLITSFSDANFPGGMDYLAFIARDYALSVALPRAKVTGTVYLESGIAAPPLVFTKGALNYWLQTWSWNLYEDELEIEGLTLPSASLTVESETILESNGSTVSSAGGAGSSGAGSSIGGGGTNYWEIDSTLNTLLKPKSAYSYLGVKDGIFFEGATQADFEVVTVAGVGRVIHSRLPFYSDGFVSAGGHSSGGGSEGASLAAVWASLKTNSDDYANEKINAYHIPIGTGLEIQNGLIVATNAGTITSVTQGTAVAGGNVSTSGGVVTIQFPTVPNVPSWALASTKPSYAFSEITGTASTSQIPNLSWNKITSDKPTTLGGYGITDAKFGTAGSDYIPITLGSTTKNVLTAHQSLSAYITSATAASTYQPLDADLTSIAGLSGTSGFLKKTAANTWSLDTNSYGRLYTATVNSGKVIRITFNDTFNTIVSVRRSNESAGLILAGNGYGATTVRQTWAQISPYSIFTWSVPESEGISRAIEIYNPEGNPAYVYVLEFGSASPTFTEYSSLYTTGGNYPIANIYSNVASATKLQTSRTIWGQSFDGSANVSGAMTGVTTISASGQVEVGSLKLTGTNAIPTLSWDASASAWKLSGNFYATGWVSAGGVSGSGGSGGIDADAMWGLLANTDSTKQINVAHLSTALSSYVPANATNATNARYVIGDNNAVSPQYALLQSGSGRQDASPEGDTWIYYDTAGGSSTPWGIRHNQGLDTIGFLGRGVENITLSLRTGAITGTSFVKSGGTSSQFLKADGSIDSSTYLTGINSTMVTNALGYTPANSTALTNYLPLTGGKTITGWVTFDTGTTSEVGITYDINRASSSLTGAWAYAPLIIRDVNNSTLFQIGVYGSSGTLSYAYLGVNAYNGDNLRISSSGVSWGANLILHAGNYSSYALPLTGGTISNSVYYPLTINNSTSGTTLAGIQFNGAGTRLGNIFVNGADSTLHFYYGSTDNVVLHSGNYSSYALPLTGGTLKKSTRDILVLNQETTSTGVVGPYITFSVNGTSAAGIGSNSSVGAYLENDNASGHPYINLDNSGVLKRNNTDVFYHSGNSNKSDVAWACSTLTASGNIQANAGVTIANNQSYGGLDTDGTRRTLLSIDPSNAAFLAWGNAGAGHNTYVSGNNISFTYGTSHTTGMYLNSSGNVGIGTASPSYKLDVNGAARFGTSSVDNTAFYSSQYAFVTCSTESSGEAFDESKSSWGITFQRAWNPSGTSTVTPAAAGIYAFGSSGWRAGLAFRVKNNQTSTGSHDITAMVLSPGGRIGMGTLSPETKLHVHYTNYPNVILSTTSPEVSIYYRNSSNVYWAAGVGCWGSTAGYTSFVFGVYSGTGSSAYKAYITNTGNFVAVGAITAGAASDARLKTNISTLSDSDAKALIMALRPVTFTWNDKATELYDQYKGNDLGFVAQEVENVLPVAIGTIFEKYKRLDQTKFIAPLVAVAKDHETRIEKLEKEVKAKDAKIMELESEIKQLRMN